MDKIEVNKLETVIWCKFCGTVAKGTVAEAQAHAKGECLEKSLIWRRWKSKRRRINELSN